MHNQVVWFKRDLRVEDHAPLYQASKAGPCICLYVYEPELLASAEFDPSHLVFINQSLEDLDKRLTQIGSRLTTMVGNPSEVFDKLYEEVGFDALWSHQETGSAITYQRDLRVAVWAKTRGVKWNQIQQHGVFRALSTRDGWANKWLLQMKMATATTPTHVNTPTLIPSKGILPYSSLGLPKSTKTHVQPGGETQAQTVLESFLKSRSENYRTAMSSPLTAWEGCSRLSAHIAWGNVSVRQVYQSTRARIEEIKNQSSERPTQARSWAASLHAFEQRLRWHCHFIQKLEDEPELEFNNLNRAYDGLRENEFDELHFRAWCAGQTGYPLVDACMRALHEGGWINFRMRAMLVSFASYQLWLHWRSTAVFLAQHFLDFEPGIHFSQVQMQSGVTGINAIRIYSPIKQVYDQDPEGVFIKRYCPELARVPPQYIAEPQKMPTHVQREVGCIIGQHYPAPIVEHARAYRQARSRIYAVKGSKEARAEAHKVYQKHGSRRKPTRRLSK